MKHILSVTDCGINSEPAKEEPTRVSLIREIYDFLNYHVCLFAFTWRLWFGTQLKTEFLSRKIGVHQSWHCNEQACRSAWESNRDTRCIKPIA